MISVISMMSFFVKDGPNTVIFTYVLHLFPQPGSGKIFSVADPDPFDTDPDPAFHFDPNPDPAFQFDMDPVLTVCYGSESLPFHRGDVYQKQYFLYILT